MDQWIQIFRTGRHIDSSGQEKEWSKEDLDKIVYSYNPLIHEAPVVIGHPKENAPAYGWIEALKREGQFLYAKLKNLVPEFVDMVKRGLFKKRSISLYPDLTIRHIGFLGAMPPAIKGLDNIQFMERGQSATYFSETEETEEYWKGENKMGNSNFENPAEKLHRRVMDILRDPSKAANYGEKLRDKTSYRQVLEIVLQEDPELAKIYGEGISPLQWEKRRKAKAQDAVNKIASLAREKMKDDATLSYGEALRKARDENPDLVEEYESWR